MACSSAKSRKISSRVEWCSDTMPMKGTPAADAKTMIYVNVCSIAATIEKAQRLGAMLIKPRTEIPGGHGWFAQIKMPEGNIWGIYSRS